jgi:ketosteroid isomerase-like protein
MAAAAQMGNARSDTEQLIANEKVWAQAAQGSDADRMASYMAETLHLQGTLAVVTGEYSQTGTRNGKDISATGIYANTWLKRNGRWVVIDSVFP